MSNDEDKEKNNHCNQPIRVLLLKALGYDLHALEIIGACKVLTGKTEDMSRKLKTGSSLLVAIPTPEEKW